MMQRVTQVAELATERIVPGYDNPRTKFSNHARPRAALKIGGTSSCVRSAARVCSLQMPFCQRAFKRDGRNINGEWQWLST
jgi:hypothetical protein